MSEWLQQTGIGLIAWGAAGAAFECIRHTPDHWWLWAVAFVLGVIFWVALDWHARAKRAAA